MNQKDKERIEAARKHAGKAFEYNNIRRRLAATLQFYDQTLVNRINGGDTSVLVKETHAKIAELTNQEIFNLEKETSDALMVQFSKDLHEYGDNYKPFPVENMNKFVNGVYEQYQEKKIAKDAWDKKASVLYHSHNWGGKGV